MNLQLELFLINKPMKLEGNEVPLTLKKNWGHLEISSFSGRQSLLELT